jgi:hypothetical protein
VRPVQKQQLTRRPAKARHVMVALLVESFVLGVEVFFVLFFFVVDLVLDFFRSGLSESHLGNLSESHFSFGGFISGKGGRSGNSHTDGISSGFDSGILFSRMDFVVTFSGARVSFLNVNKSDVEVTAGLTESFLGETVRKDFGFISVERSFGFGKFVTGSFGISNKV